MEDFTKRFKIYKDDEQVGEFDRIYKAEITLAVLRIVHPEIHWSIRAAPLPEFENYNLKGVKVTCEDEIIEIDFAFKPDPETRNDIKSLGFKWNRATNLWNRHHSIECDKVWQDVLATKLITVRDPYKPVQVDETKLSETERKQLERRRRYMGDLADV